MGKLFLGSLIFGTQAFYTNQALQMYRKYCADNSIVPEVTMMHPAGTLPIPMVALCGVLTGWSMVVPVVAIDQIKASLQVQYKYSVVPVMANATASPQCVAGPMHGLVASSTLYDGFFGCARTRIEAFGLWHGLFGCWRATALEMSGMGLFFAIYAGARRYFLAQNQQQSLAASSPSPAAAVTVGVLQSSPMQLTVFQSPPPPPLAAWQTCVAGSLAGMSFLLLYPFDYVKCRMMTQYDMMYHGGQGMLNGSSPTISLDPKAHYATNIERLRRIRANRDYHGVIDCARKILAEEGARTFFRGWLPSLCRAGVSNAAGFFCYEFILANT